MSFKTADLADEHGDRIRVAESTHRDFGGRMRFHGPIHTVKCFQDNSKVREALGTPGEGAVLVVDGGGSMRCALLGDQLAALAIRNGWAGVVIDGCVRDAEELATMPLGIKAIGTSPQKSDKHGRGERDVPVHFAEVTFSPGHHLYADHDGIVVSPLPLL